MGEAKRRMEAMHASKQIFRCYPMPEPKEKGATICSIVGFEADSDIAAEIDRVGALWAGPMLFLDFETLTGAKEGQALRFGFFQERGLRYDWRVAEAAAGTLTREKLDRLWHQGLVYEPKNNTDEDIGMLEYYADECGLDLYTQAEFVKEILYRNHYVKRADKWEDCLREPCYVVGHNLPFDLGALAIHCGLAKKDLYGGLSLVMAGGEHDLDVETEEEYAARLEEWRKASQNQVTLLLSLGDETAADQVRTASEPKRRSTFEHRIAIKKLGFGKHLYRSEKQRNGSFADEFGATKPLRMEMLNFVDTQTLARALLGPGPSSMKALLKRLNVPKEFQKETADYNGPITFDYINYCRSDVENTRQIFKGCRELYKRAELSTPMHKLYSEASTGKAWLKEFGIEGFNELNPHFDKTVLGCFMESYYGGKADVRIRHKIVEVIHNDFTSQYPTLNVLKGLQELLIAEHIGVKRDDPEARRFLETVELDDLRSKETWKKLRGAALIVPNDDDLPFRTQYGTNEDGSITVNIGVNRVISACPAWYTFDDIITSKLLTGKTPKILKTLELYPIGRQSTNVIKLFGEDRYEVDLSKDDLFATLIDARIDVQKERDDPLTPEDRKAFLESFQNGLKITGNGTSYGVPNEFIVDDHLKEVPTTVYFGGTSAKIKARLHSVGKDGDQEISDYKAEKAGRYYGPWGVLIPSGGRLLLGIAERLAADRGLTYAFCDTDSMAFCDYWQRYTREEFREKVKEITDWFQPLNPYKNDVRLFGFEKVNYKLKDRESGDIVKGEFEPLYCLAVSSKRYCLFNRDKCGTPIIRKASAHGLGDVMLPASEAKSMVCNEPEENDDIDWSQVDPDDIVSTNGAAATPVCSYEAQFEHYAAPIKRDDDGQPMLDKYGMPTRVHGKLVAGSAAPLFLDMWMAAITELDEHGNLDGVDQVIGEFKGLEAPQHSQTTLSTRDAWLHYQSLPNRRAFQFMTTLPAPMQSMTKSPLSPDYNPPVTPSTKRIGNTHDSILTTEFAAAQKSSLYTPSTKPFKLDLYELYRRDTNELIKPYLDVGLELVTVAQRLKGYFAHGEAKSQGSVGLLTRKCVVGLTKVWIGKESHPLADVEDLPDDETLEHYKTSGEIVEGGLNHDLIVQAGIEKVAEAARVDEIMLVDAVLSQKTLPEDAIERIKAAIVINPDTSIEVVAVPVTKQENAMDRVYRLLEKHQHVRELEKFIYATIERTVTHEQILRDLAEIGSRVEPRLLTLVEIETFAKQFYGFTERIEKKLAKEQKQALLFAETAKNARARRDKSRGNKKNKEIERVAEYWNLPEIKSAKSVKHAHLIDKDLNEIASTKCEQGMPSLKPVKIVCSPHLRGNEKKPELKRVQIVELE